MQTLDGNAIAGLLHEIFGEEMTAVTVTCGSCGFTAPVVQGPGKGNHAIQAPQRGSSLRCEGGGPARIRRPGAGSRGRHRTAPSTSLTLPGPGLRAGRFCPRTESSPG
jgi:uncharacterized protein DUF6510